MLYHIFFMYIEFSYADMYSLQECHAKCHNDEYMHEKDSFEHCQTWKQGKEMRIYTQFKYGDVFFKKNLQ